MPPAARRRARGVVAETRPGGRVLGRRLSVLKPTSVETVQGESRGFAGPRTSGRREPEDARGGAGTPATAYSAAPGVPPKTRERTATGEDPWEVGVAVAGETSPAMDLHGEAEAETAELHRPESTVRELP